MANADASFAIEIAAEMGGGEHTIAELDKMVSAFTGAGKGASALQEAIKRAGADLTAATAAQQSANEALRAGEQEYSRLEAAALQAAKAAERLAAKGMTREYLAAAKASSDAEVAVNQYAGKLRVLETNAASAKREQDRLAQTFGNVKKLGSHADKVIAQNAEKLSKLGGALGAVGGPLGGLGQKLVMPVKGFADLTSTMGSARAAAVLLGVGAFALVAAVAAVTAAVIAGTIKIAAWAASLADAARTAGLSRDAFEAMNPGVAALRSNIDALAGETGLATTEINAIAKSLIAAKVPAADLPEALRAAALAERALGKGGAQEFITQIGKAKDEVSALARETQRKLGPIVAKQMRSIDAQTARAKKGFAELFSGLNIEPVLDGMQILADLFDKNTVAGETLKFLFEEIFQPIIDQARNAAYVVEAFYLGFLIGLTKIFIALKPVIRAVGEFFGFEDTSLETILGAVTKAGEFAAYVFAGIVVVFGALAAAVAIALVPIIAIQVAIYALITAVIAVGAAIVSGFISALTTAKDFLTSFDLVQTGVDIMMGLARGIGSAAMAVWNAITGAISGAINAAKSMLGIASPSKVFAEIGVNTGEGMTAGVEDSAADVRGAFEEMASPEAALDAGSSAALASPADAPAATPGGGGASISLDGATFHFHGVKDAESAKQLFEEMLTRVIEGDALALGADEAAPA